MNETKNMNCGDFKKDCKCVEAKKMIIKNVWMSKNKVFIICKYQIIWSEILDEIWPDRFKSWLFLESFINQTWFKLSKYVLIVAIRCSKLSQKESFKTSITRDLWFNSKPVDILFFIFIFYLVSAAHTIEMWCSRGRDCFHSFFSADSWWL